MLRLDSHGCAQMHCLSDEEEVTAPFFSPLLPALFRRALYFCAVNFTLALSHFAPSYRKARVFTFNLTLRLLLRPFLRSVICRAP